MTPHSLFCEALLRALNAPGRETRLAHINAGHVVVTGSDGVRRGFRGARRGTGDLGGYCRPDGLHVEVECKTGTGRLNPDQRTRRDRLAEAGCVYVLAHWDGVEPLDVAVARAAALVDAAIAARRARGQAEKAEEVVSCPVQS